MSGLGDPGDPTIRVPGVGGTVPPPRREGRWWWYAVAAVVLVAVLVLVVVLLGDDDDTADPSETTAPAETTVGSDTTVATTTTATDAPTTAAPPPTAAPTTAAPGPAITTFDAPESVTCNAPTSVELTWDTTGATSVDVSIDGPGVFSSHGPSGTSLFPFACDGNPHTYLLTARGAGGATATRQVTIIQAG